MPCNANPIALCLERLLKSPEVQTLQPQHCWARAWRVSAGLSLAFISAGCALPGPQAPAQLYALGSPTKLSRDAAANSATPTCHLQFALRELELAGALDRPEVILRRDGPRLQASPMHLWAAPLRSELSRLLGAGLEQSLRGARQWPYPLRFGQRPDVMLSVTFDDFTHTGEAMLLSMRWQAWTIPVASQPARWLAGQTVQMTQPVSPPVNQAGGNDQASQTVALMNSTLQSSIDLLAKQLISDPAIAPLCQPATSSGGLPRN
jgi:uncharacterized lipoprotein YmbA